MKFSLVLGTVGRTSELETFLRFLNAQTYRNFELIVVDQNDDDRLVPILSDYQDHFDIRHMRAPRGLSRARNVGLTAVSGDVIAFPDDDCWYPPTLLERVATILRHHQDLDGLTGRFTDGSGRSEGRWLPESMPLTRFNVWRGAISFSIFLRRVVVDRTGKFNEALGVGAGTPWGAAEETDYLLRSIANGFKLEFFHDLILHHPVKSFYFDEAACKRQQKYEAGIGRVIRLNHYPFWYFPLVCLRTCAGICIALAHGRLAQARFKKVSIGARIAGWRASVDQAVTVPAVSTTTHTMELPHAKQSSD
jgi:glycosyltransferase involved in cell wall biosynthesis